MKSTNVHKPRFRALKQCLQMSTRSLKSLINSIFIKEEAFINSTDDEKMLWQNKVVLFYFTTLYMVGVFIAVFGDLNPKGIFYKYANSAQGICIIVAVLLHLKKVVSIRTLMKLILSICMIEISVEMFYQALYDGDKAPFHIMTNMMLLTTIATIAALSYVRKLPIYMCAGVITSYVVCAYISEGRELLDFSYLIALSFVGITFMGFHLAKNFKMLRTENQLYKEDQEQLLDYMQLTKQQWRELMDVLKIKGKKLDPERVENTEKIIELFEERLRSRIIYQAKEMLKEEKDYTVILLEKLPSLTETELKIANFIVKGLSTAEIASTLSISISTVTTMRSRIRTRCELERDVNLQSHLLQVIGVEEEVN